MLQLDYPTLSLVVGVVGIVGIFVMLAVWRINPDIPGPGIWTAAAVIGGGGFALVALQPLFGSYSTMANNIASLVAPVLVLEGLLRFRGLGDPQHRRLPGVLLLVAIVVLAWLNREDAARRYLFHDAVAFLLLLLAAAVMLWQSRGLERLVLGVTAGFFVLLAAGYAWRWGVALTAPPGLDLPRQPVMGILYFLIVLWSLGWTYGLSLAVNLRNQQAIAATARLDPLTGLANRRWFGEAAAAALRRVARRDERLALVLLDLDGFKLLNDRHGHAFGDAVLRGLAARLKQATRATDLPARIGGDEFVVLLDLGARPEAAQQAIDRLRAALHPPLQIDGRRTPIEASLGGAVFPDDGSDVSSLLRCADTRMYKEKEAHAAARASGGVQPL